MHRLLKLASALLMAFYLSSTAQAQTYSGTFTGIVTTSQLNDMNFGGDPFSYDFNGKTITGTFQINIAGGVTDASYAGVLPAYSFSGHGDDADDDFGFDWASFSSNGVTGTLAISPDLIGIDSWANFSIAFNMAALNNPLIPLTGTGNFNFYSNQGGTGGGDLDGYINFTVTSGTLAGVVPEPETWALMIGGMFLMGAGLRRVRRRTAIA
ncbi:MAG: PEP-CTERM sorting domain-containing protein [Sphingomonas sp.]